MWGFSGGGGGGGEAGARTGAALEPRGARGRRGGRGGRRGRGRRRRGRGRRGRRRGRRGRLLRRAHRLCRPRLVLHRRRPVEAQQIIRRIYLVVQVFSSQVRVQIERHLLHRSHSGVLGRVLLVCRGLLVIGWQLRLVLNVLEFNARQAVTLPC